MFNTKKYIAIFIICVFLLLIASFSVAEDFPLPNKGTLSIQVPPNWQSQFRQPPGELPPTIRLSNNNSLLLITPLWNSTGDETFNSDENLKKLIENDGRKMINTAIETELEISKITGENLNGYYFQLTDKNPKPGEFKYLCRSGASVGELLLSLTFLSHHRDITEFLDIISTANHIQ